MKIGKRTDTLSLVSDINSAAMGVEFVNGFSVAASWDDPGSDISGVLTLQASNNAFTDNVNMTPDPNALWIDITGSAVAVSDVGTQFWNVADANYSAYRIKWVGTSGSSTLTAYHLIKGPQ